MDDISTVDRDADVVQQMVAPGGHAEAAVNFHTFFPRARRRCR
jgi:hypothetical protein